MEGSQAAANGISSDIIPSWVSHKARWYGRRIVQLGGALYGERILSLGRVLCGGHIGGHILGVGLPRRRTWLAKQPIL